MSIQILFRTVCIALCFYFSVVDDGQALAREQAVSGRLIDEIKAHDSGVAIWWTGHNGWLIKSDTLLMSTDLVVAEEEHYLIQEAPVSAEELADELDIVFVTHEHGDHFNGPTCKILAAKPRCLFVMPQSCVAKAHELGIPDSRIMVAKPREPFSVYGVEVEPVRAIHGNPRFAVYWDANLEDCGYLIKTAGKKIFQPGDSVLLEDHFFLKHVDVLFFSPTEHNMQVDRSLILINELEPEVILPQHRNTYKVTPENRFWTTAYPYEVKMRLSKALQERYHVLEIGERIDVEP
jgi:L-ascorbate metabolism protein UlaG (beta-lactamase superfamily)